MIIAGQGREQIASRFAVHARVVVQVHFDESRVVVGDALDDLIGIHIVRLNWGRRESSLKTDKGKKRNRLLTILCVGKHHASA